MMNNNNTCPGTDLWSYNFSSNETKIRFESSLQYFANKQFENVNWSRVAGNRKYAPPSSTKSTSSRNIFTQITLLNCILQNLIKICNVYIVYLFADLIHLHMSFMWYCDKARDMYYQKMEFGFIGIFCLGIFTQITLGKIVHIDNDVTYDNGGTQRF